MQGKLQSIQAMRGIAALLVVIFHISTLSRIAGTSRSQELGAFWDRGFAGVDMFFVISGFIMVYMTRNIGPSIANFRHFLWRRCLRIYPLWWIYALFMMGYFYVAYGQLASPDIAKGDAVISHILKSLALIPQATEPVLGVGWTLIHEMMFYILFAFTLLLPRKFLPIFLILWAALIIGASTFGTKPLHAENYPQLFLSPLNLEFILGAFVGLWLTLGHRKISPYIFWAGCALFIAALMIHLPGQKSLFNWQRVLAYGLPSAMILGGAVWLEQQGQLKTPSFLVHLGNWSYSLYLAHFLVLLALRRIWQMVNDKAPGTEAFNAQLGIHTVGFIVLGLVLSIVAAAVSFYMIEKPMLKILGRKRISS